MALEHEIALLGQRMGISGLALSPTGRMAFDVAGLGRVHFELSADSGSGGDLLIYLSRPVPDHDRAGTVSSPSCDWRLNPKSLYIFR